MRRTALILATCSSLLWAGCQGDPASSGTPSATEDEATSTPSTTLSPTPTTPEASATPASSAAAEPSTPNQAASFAFNDILRVEVDALAARVAPYPDMPLATGWTLVEGTMVNIDEVRLDAGDFVSVDLGPVQIGDTTWYRVWPAEDATLHYSTISWDTRNDGANPVEPAWVASAVGSDAYLTLYEAFEPDPWLAGLPLLAAGSGDYLSGPLDNFDLFVLDWAYLIDDQLAPCDFGVTVEPASGGAGVVVLDESTTGAFEEGTASLGTGSGVPIVGEAGEPIRVRVESGCEWTLRLEPLPHD